MTVKTYRAIGCADCRFFQYNVGDYPGSVAEWKSAYDMMCDALRHMMLSEFEHKKQHVMLSAGPLTYRLSGARTPDDIRNLYIIDCVVDRGGPATTDFYQQLQDQLERQAP